MMKIIRFFLVCGPANEPLYCESQWEGETA